jgi:hypothetical protein
MKRLFVMVVVAALALCAFYGLTDNPAQAGRGRSYTNSFEFTHTAQKAAAVTTETTSVLSAGTSSPPFLFTGLENYGPIRGVVNIVTDSSDTTINGEFPNPALDTVYMDFLTTCGNYGDAATVVKTIQLDTGNVDLGDVWFSLPSDSVCSKLYARFRVVFADSNHSAVNDTTPDGDTVTLGYTVSIDMSAKP